MKKLLKNFGISSVGECDVTEAINHNKGVVLKTSISQPPYSSVRILKNDLYGEAPPRSPTPYPLM